LDMYWLLKAHLNPARRSQAHMLRFLGMLPEECDADHLDAKTEQKMDLSPEFWNAVLANPKKYLPVMKKRCESDCSGLKVLLDKTKHLAREIKRG